MAGNIERNYKRERRKFIQLACAGLAAEALLSACGDPGQTEAPQRELAGVIEGKYSQFVTDHQLIPTEPQESDPVESRIAEGIDYLRKYQQAMKEEQAQREQFAGDNLGAHDIVSAPYFPVDIPYDEAGKSSPWTISDVVDAFLKEIDEGRVKVTYDKKLKGIFAQNRPTFVNNNGVVTRTESSIVFGTTYAEKNTVNETTDTFYNFPTDAETAAVLIHEYTHSLQDDAIMNGFNKHIADGDSQLNAVLHDTESIQAWEREEVKKNNERLREWTVDAIKSSTAITEENKSKLEGVINTSDFREVQANAVMYQFLNSLNRANKSEHFPGTRTHDPIIPNADNSPYTIFAQKVIGSTWGVYHPAWTVVSGQGTYK